MPDQRPILLGLNAGLMVVTFAAICCRVGRRTSVVGKLGYHDVLISAAAICAFIFSICLCIAATYGLGLHSSQLTDGELSKLKRLMLISNVFYFSCNWFVKHALLAFYAEIALERKYRVSIYFMHFVAFGFGLSSVLVNVFQCTPVAKAYTPDLKGHCVNMGDFLYANSSIMMTTDLVLYIMPVVFTWNLQLRKAQRWGVNFLFGLGILVLIASAARVAACHYFATRDDFPWWFGQVMICSAVENHIAIFVTCAPSIKVVTLYIFPRLKSSYNRAFSRSSWSRTAYDSQQSGTRKSDKTWSTQSNTPLPSPALTAGSPRTGGFRQFLRSPTSPRRAKSSDSMDHALVDIENAAGDVKHWDDRSRKAIANRHGDTDIRVEHTIDVESSRESREDKGYVIGKVG